MSLQNKKILIGVTGGIAAYKIPLLIRLLIKSGAEVRVVMTRAAGDFVTPQVLSVLSKNTVHTDFFDESHNWNNHVELSEWADVFLIAPLTANTLAKMASGGCDNLLLACYLSARAKTIVAPAMDLEMFQHPTVKKNLETIRSHGNGIIPAETGELASGMTGEGRMAEPENILKFLIGKYSSNLPLWGKKALVNAGPTYEAIDPVRFIGNRSSGKMGIALAGALAAFGAQVTLVLGPSAEAVPSGVSVERVESSDEMYESTLRGFAGADIVICAAAVADYRPESPARQKIKKKESSMDLHLVATRDILRELGQKKTKQFLVGFALETENLEENAKEKLLKKNLDMVVANSASEAGSGFGVDTNRLTILDKHNKITKFELLSKSEAAARLVNLIVTSIGKP